MVPGVFSWLEKTNLSKKVFLAVGHGRRPDGVMDPGATLGSSTEQNQGDPIVRAARDRLVALGVTVRTVLAGGPDFSGAASQANSWGADVAVEVHHDWSGAPRGCFGHWYPGSSQGKALADAMRDAVVGGLSYPHRADWHRERNLAWVRLTNMPSVLWECDRIGSVNDHAAYGRALANGIAAYLGITTSPEPEPEEEDIFDMARNIWYSHYVPRDAEEPQVIPAGETRAIQFSQSSNENVSPDNQYVSWLFSVNGPRRLLTGSAFVRVEPADGSEPGAYYLFPGRAPDGNSSHDLDGVTRYLGMEHDQERCAMPLPVLTAVDGTRCRLYLTAYDKDLHVTGCRVTGLDTAL